MLFLLCIAILGTLIFAASRVSEWIYARQINRKHEKSYQRREQYYERYGNTTKPSSNAIAARLHSIYHQFNAYKEQQHRQERKRTTREVITLIVIGITAFFAFGSDWIFYDQLTEMRVERRAWVGPISAGFSGALPKVGEESTFSVEFHNTGREPAFDLFSDLTPFMATLEDTTDGVTAARIDEYVRSCRLINPALGKNVAFPTTAFSHYTSGKRIDGHFIDWNIIYGISLLFVNGCYVYNTLGVTHRTSFCFVFQNGPKMTPQSWAFCQTGNNAD